MGYRRCLTSREGRKKRNKGKRKARKNANYSSLAWVLLHLNELQFPLQGGDGATSNFGAKYSVTSHLDQLH